LKTEVLNKAFTHGLHAHIMCTEK